MEYVRNVCISVLSAGPIPPHVGFVMDGNRRFARQQNKPVQEGHDSGFKTLKSILEVCLKLGVKCVTIYAFSIENFKRPRTEVDALMKLAVDKIQELCQKRELLDEYGVRLNVIGRREMLPAELQKVIEDAERITEEHDRAILNICMPYTSQDEITTALNRTIEERMAEDGEVPSYIHPDEVEANLETRLKGSPPLDILIRTSGVKRFSDFLLWQQSAATEIYFVQSYWPDFGMRDFVPVILDYQKKVWSGQIKPAKS